MKSLTKNHQPAAVITKLAEHCFPSCKLSEYKELTEGYFNAAYEVTLSDNRQVILKVAPAPDTQVMTYEKNIMHTEIQAMRMAKAADLPVPEVLGYDESCTICSSPYFFMSKLDGESLYSIKENMPPAQVASVHQEMGSICRRINEITCPRFGYPGQTAFQGGKWYPVFRKMLCGGIEDARQGSVNLKIDTDWLLEALGKDQMVFDEVTTPRLVHWDCWDGNIFVKNGRVTGIIDWERALWADPLMEVGFRTYAPDRDFMDGYGMVLTKNQERRALWYDIYLMILVSLECQYRQYETMDMYNLASETLAKQVGKLNTQLMW